MVAGWWTNQFHHQKSKAENLEILEFFHVLPPRTWSTLIFQVTSRKLLPPRPSFSILPLWGHRLRAAQLRPIFIYVSFGPRKSLTRTHTCCGSFPLLTTRSPNMSYNHIFNTTSMMGYKGIQTCREREGERERQTKNKTYFSHPAHQSLSPNHRAKWRPRSSKDFHSWLSQWPNAMRECETCENFPVSSGQGLYKITGFKHVNPCLVIWKFPSLGSNDLLLGPLSKTIIPTSDSGDWWEIVSNDVTQHWGSESHGYGSNFFKKTAARLTWYKVAKPMPTVNPYITIGIVI